MSTKHVELPADDLRTGVQFPPAPPSFKRPTGFGWFFFGCQSLCWRGFGGLGLYPLPSTDVARQLIEAIAAFGGMRDVATILPTASGNPINYPTTDATREEGEIVGENRSVSAQDFSFGVRTLGAYKYSSKSVAVPFDLLPRRNQSGSAHQPASRTPYRPHHQQTLQRRDRHWPADRHRHCRQRPGNGRKRHRHHGRRAI